MKVRLRDLVKISGTVDIVVRRHGRIVSKQTIENLVVTSGRQLLATLLAGTATRPNYLAVGTSSTGAALGDTALGGEVARIALTTGSAAAGVVTLSIYLPTTKANGSTLRECGLFNDASAGTLFARATFSSIVKDASTTVSFTWQITITSS